MNFSGKYLQIDSKYKIFLREWLPNQKSEKNVFIIHGLGEHSGRYEDFAKNLTQKNIGVFCIDLIGHGKSCLLYTSPSPRDLSTSRMPSSA